MFQMIYSIIFWDYNPLSVSDLIKEKYMLGPRQKQLVDALRSGRFIQGTGCLQSVIGNDSAYCCLGVACKIAEENGIPVVCDSNAKIYGKTLFNQPSVKSWSEFF